MPKVSAKGQVAIPLSLRKEFGIEIGSEIDFEKLNGQLVIVPVKKAKPIRRKDSFIKLVEEMNIEPSSITDEEIEQLKQERRMRRGL